MNKVDKYISDQATDIMYKNTNDIFSLGAACGYLSLYQYIEKTDGIEKTKEYFKTILDEDNTNQTCIYFKKLIELYEKDKDHESFDKLLDLL